MVTLFRPLFVLSRIMSCHIRCDSCDLDRRLEDCVTAHRLAKEHEGEYADHFVSLGTSN